jgi:hypothetical protein
MIDISCIYGKIKNVYISVDCSPEGIHIYTNLFKEFLDVFTWSYEDFPGIDPHVFKHDIKTYLNAKLV